MINGDAADLDAFGEFGIPAHVIQKNLHSQIRIGISEFHGRESIHIRAFFDSGEGYHPTRRGVTIPTRLFPELLRGVLELGATLGVIDPETLANVTLE